MNKPRILVFRIGNLGDSLVALPALWFVREFYEGAHVTLLCNHSGHPRELSASDLFHDTGLFDDFLHYRGRLAQLPLCGSLLDYARLLTAIRWRQFDKLVYLPPSRRTSAEIARDRNFFRLAGIRDVIGMPGTDPTQRPAPLTEPCAKPRARQPHEAQNLLDGLQGSGLPVPSLDACRFDVGIPRTSRQSFKAWSTRQASDGQRPWVAVGIGSKMPSKLWPVDRYQAVVAKLIRDFDIWPVVCGGPEDRALGETLLAAWGCGYLAAGELTLGESVAALERCGLYVGNDTGTMHMAASAGVRCVAIFSARDWPGKWYPLGAGHVVLRKSIDCEGCLLVECGERKNECLTRISVDDVYQACEHILRDGGSRRRYDDASPASTSQPHTINAKVRR